MAVVLTEFQTRVRAFKTVFCGVNALKELSCADACDRLSKMNALPGVVEFCDYIVRIAGSDGVTGAILRDSMLKALKVASHIMAEVNVVGAAERVLLSKTADFLNAVVRLASASEHEVNLSRACLSREAVFRFQYMTWSDMHVKAQVERVAADYVMMYYYNLSRGENCGARVEREFESCVPRIHDVMESSIAKMATLSRTDPEAVRADMAKVTYRHTHVLGPLARYARLWRDEFFVYQMMVNEHDLVPLYTTTYYSTTRFDPVFPKDFYRVVYRQLMEGNFYDGAGMWMFVMRHEIPFIASNSDLVECYDMLNECQWCDDLSTGARTRMDLVKMLQIIVLDKLCEIRCFPNMALIRRDWVAKWNSVMLACNKATADLQKELNKSRLVREKVNAAQTAVVAFECVAVVGLMRMFTVVLSYVRVETEKRRSEYVRQWAKAGGVAFMRASVNITAQAPNYLMRMVYNIGRRYGGVEQRFTETQMCELRIARSMAYLHALVFACTYGLPSFVEVIRPDTRCVFHMMIDHLNRAWNDKVIHLLQGIVGYVLMKRADASRAELDACLEDIRNNVKIDLARIPSEIKREVQEDIVRADISKVVVFKFVMKVANVWRRLDKSSPDDDVDMALADIGVGALYILRPLDELAKVHSIIYNPAYETAVRHHFLAASDAEVVPSTWNWLAMLNRMTVTIVERPVAPPLVPQPPLAIKRPAAVGVLPAAKRRVVGPDAI